MSNANPTALRIGMTGLLDGRRYTVLGRVVLGVRIDGETYYWNEFYLGDATGLELTLVYEEVEEGSNWKVFKMFDPTRPLAAREAAAKRVGDPVDLGGKSGRISLVDQSRVYHIEGAAPEGTEVGDVANYFNADYGDRMIAVSWTGEEIEFYDGGPIAAWRVEEAFKLPKSRAKSAASGVSSLLGGWKWDSNYTTAAVVLGMLVLYGVIVYSDNAEPTPSPPPPPKIAAPAKRIAVGAHVALGGHRFTVTGYSLVEVGQVGKRFNRHEYVLTDEAGKNALLVQGLTGQPNQWHLFGSEIAGGGGNGVYYAELRAGASFTSEDRNFKVTELFQSTALSIEGRSAAAFWPSPVLFGLVAQANDEWFMARWSETNLRYYYQGHWIAERDLMAALSKGS